MPYGLSFTVTRERAVLLGFLGVALVAVMDAAIGFEISLLILHVIPVLFVTWFAGPGWGVFFAALMALISAATLSPATPQPEHPYLDFLALGSDFIATMLLVFMQSRLRTSYERMTRQSKSDVLTGCLNRRGFDEQLELEIERTRRYRHAFSLVYFDCDNFKEVNDTQGHHAGDALLAEIGRVLRTATRAVDVAARLGGDEFAVLLRESDADAALHAVGSLKTSLDETMRKHGWPVGFSIGIAGFDQPPADADKALSLADALMYEVKKHGKNNILMRRF